MNMLPDLELSYVIGIINPVVNSGSTARKSTTFSLGTFGVKNRYMTFYTIQKVAINYLRYLSFK